MVTLPQHMGGNMTQFQFFKPLRYMILNEQRITNWTQVLEVIGATTTMLQINPILIPLINAQN